MIATRPLMPMGPAEAFGRGRRYGGDLAAVSTGTVGLRPLKVQGVAGTGKGQSSGQDCYGKHQRSKDRTEAEAKRQAAAVVYMERRRTAVPTAKIARGLKLPKSKTALEVLRGDLNRLCEDGTLEKITGSGYLWRGPVPSWVGRYAEPRLGHDEVAERRQRLLDRLRASPHGLTTAALRKGLKEPEAAAVYQDLNWLRSKKLANRVRPAGKAPVWYAEQ